MKFIGFMSLLAFSFLPGLALSQESEEAVRKKIESSGGRIWTDKSGQVSSVHVFKKKSPKRDAFTDSDIIAFDFNALPALKSVAIFCANPPSNITDRSLAHLLKIETELDCLDIVGAAITDDGLVKLLRKQKKLGIACFPGTPITDRSVEEIAKMQDLLVLSLSGTKITDKGCAQLAKMNGLISLSISRTEISDAGLAHLKNMTGLIGIDLDGTKVTGAGVRELQTALPKLQIRR
jgi:hypothetical protein